MTCTVCNNPASAEDDYCAECRAAINGLCRTLNGADACTACGRDAHFDGVCRQCFDEICTGILTADARRPPSERGERPW